MFDELKLKLTTTFMRNIVSKLIAGAIRKKYGYKVDIQLNDLDISLIDGETEIRTDVVIKLDKDEFVKIVKSAGLD